MVLKSCWIDPAYTSIEISVLISISDSNHNATISEVILLYLKGFQNDIFQENELILCLYWKR